ncbi:hypothetical protein ACN27F_27800 [Solwaraspora sp. WMMB335]|uniref:hypothetical protein n=1 Tax=Solwaraspora sp. WMMB335 TaxID=3404118 RepID=UPI003B92E1D8
MVDQGWTRTSRLVQIGEIIGELRYAVEEHCAGQLMGELAGASACCLTRSAAPGGPGRHLAHEVQYRVDILLGRHLLIAGHVGSGCYARSARLTAVTLGLPGPAGVVVTARWRTHGQAESCWLGFGDGSDGRTFLLLLHAAVGRATRDRPRRQGILADGGRGGFMSEARLTRAR